MVIYILSWLDLDCKKNRKIFVRIRLDKLENRDILLDMDELYTICEKLNAEYPKYQHHHNRTWRKASKSEPWEEVEIESSPCNPEKDVIE